MRCPNCGDPNGRHYVPPSCGEEGFFICKEIISYENEMRNKNRIKKEQLKEMIRKLEKELGECYSMLEDK